MRLATSTRAVAILAQVLWLSRLDLVSSHRAEPLLDNVVRPLRNNNLAITPQVSKALPVCSLGFFGQMPGIEAPFNEESRHQAPPKYKSKYVGVRWHRPNQKWQARITSNGKTENLGYFDSEEAAARAFDKKATSLRRLVNFPGPGQDPVVKQGAQGMASRYTGVGWAKKPRVWTSSININGKRIHLGSHSSEKGAAQAYDERAGPLGRGVNFPFEKGQKRTIKGGASKYEGVHWKVDEELWEAVGIKHSERVLLGCFESEEEAARAVDGHFVDLNLPRKHFPVEGDLRLASVERTSQFVGVNRMPKNGRWSAIIIIDGKLTTLGNVFNSEQEAARAYDERAAALGKAVNFPTEGQKQAVKKGSSKFRGVYKHGMKWKAAISIDGKVKGLGTFDSEEAAARKFDEAGAPLGRAVNFPLSVVL